MPSGAPREASQAGREALFERQQQKTSKRRITDHSHEHETGNDEPTGEPPKPREQKRETDQSDCHHHI
jgi:hypothetical protein